MSLTTELADVIAGIAERVGPATVRIGSRGGRGCGLVVADGLVLTNAHNLRGSTTTVGFANGESRQGTVAGIDVDRDVAAIEVDTAAVEPPAWRDTPATLGLVVFSVGLPATGSVRVTTGTVSATQRAFRGPRGRRIRGTIEHTAPLPRGSSGSVIVDESGELVGLNTHRIGEGFYLAVPTDTDLHDQVDVLRRGETTTRPRLGVGLAPASVARKLRRSVGLDERDGLLVRSVEEGGPADRAGVAPGDLIVSLDDDQVTTADGLYDALDRCPSALRLGVVRGADDLEVRVDLD